MRCIQTRARKQRPARAGELTLFAVVSALLWSTAAADLPRGTVSAAIRSAGHPCQRVIEMEQVDAKDDGSTILHVRCNSGSFEVTVTNNTPAGVKPL